MIESTRTAADGVQHNLLSLISRKEGITVHEAMHITKMDYPGIMKAVKQLSAKGYEIGAINIGGKAYRLYQMPYELKNQ